MAIHTKRQKPNISIDDTFDPYRYPKDIIVPEKETTKDEPGVLASSERLMEDPNNPGELRSVPLSAGFMNIGMNEIDERYVEHQTDRDNIQALISRISLLPPDKQKAFLAKYGVKPEDFTGQQLIEQQKVEGGESATGSLNKEKEAQKTGIGAEPVSAFEDPAAILSALVTGGSSLIAPFLYATVFGKEAGGVAALSGAGPVLQGIAEFIGNLFNPAGEEKILAQYGPEVLAEAKSAMGAEANVTILEKLKAGIESGEIKPGKIPMNLLSKFKGILKAPKDEALRALKAGFVSPETESQLFTAQSRRINRMNHMLEVMKNSSPEEIQAIMPSLADEFIKYQELATSKITTLDKNGKTITRLSKVEYTPEQLKEIGQFAKRTDFPAHLNRVLNTTEKGGLGEAGSSQLISDISSRLYMFGKSLVDGSKGTMTERLLKAEYAAQLMNPAIPARKLVTDLAFIPFQRVAQSLAMARKHRSLDVGYRSLISALMAYKESLPEAIRMMKLSAKTGTPMFERMLASIVPEGEDVAKYGLNRRSVAYAEDAFDSTDPGMVAQYFGSWYNIGPDAIMSVDQFAKVLAWRSSQFMLAYDHALEEVEAGGRVIGMQKFTVADKMAHNYMEQMPEWLLKAQNEDMYKTTFTNTDKLIYHLTGLARELPGARILFPYIRTPINLYREGLKMSPLGFGMSFLDEPGLERGTTQAKAALGSLFATWIGYEVMAGNITGSGPTNPNKYNMNIKEPYSMWGHSYKHLGPFGAYMALIADGVENYANLSDQTDKEEMAKAVVKAVATSLSNAPTLDGMTNLVNAMEEAKSGKMYGLGRIGSNVVAGFVPAPIRMGEHIYDPTYRQAQDLVDKLRNSVPGLGLGIGKEYLGREDTIPFRKWDGTPQYLPPGVSADGTPPDSLSVGLQMLSPVPETEDVRDDLDKELERLGVEFNRPPKALQIGKDMVALTPEQQDRWNVLAGNQLQVGGMNQRDRGNDLLTRPYYAGENITDDQRKDLLKSNHYLYEGRAESLIRQELQGGPPAFTAQEDFPTKPVEPSTPPSLGE